MAKFALLYQEDINNDPRDLCFNLDTGELQYYQQSVMATICYGSC